jgi:hypothetical protein
MRFRLYAIVAMPISARAPDNLSSIAVWVDGLVVLCHSEVPRLVFNQIESLVLNKTAISNRPQLKDECLVASFVSTD